MGAAPGEMVYRITRLRSLDGMPFALHEAFLPLDIGSRLARLDLRLSYAPDKCPADRTLQVHMKNGNSVPLTELRWRVAAYAPGDTVNLAENTYNAPRYRGPGELQPGAEWTDCLPLPPLRSGYRPQTLEFRAEHLQGTFAN